MKIISNRDKIVGMKSRFYARKEEFKTFFLGEGGNFPTCSPFVSSQRPNTELAAARTEHRELRVVVMPA